MSAVYGVSSTGLVCSWGSKLDEKAPRAKLPKHALPPSVRKQLGLRPNTTPNPHRNRGSLTLSARNGGTSDGSEDPNLTPEERRQLAIDEVESEIKRLEAEEDEAFWQPGFGGVQEQRGAGTDEYSAGNQKHFLKRGSGVPMSHRASRYAQERRQQVRRKTHSSASSTVLAGSRPLSARTFSTGAPDVSVNPSSGKKRGSTSVATTKPAMASGRSVSFATMNLEGERFRCVK